MSRAHGRITVVWTKDLGTTLTQDEAAGATVLHVDDVAPFNDDEVFDEDGNLGYLQVGDQTVGYTSVDDDASTIMLADPLAVDADEDDDVLVWDDLYGEVDTQQWAWVEPDGGDRQDPYEVEVDDSFELVDGDRGKRGESCTIRRLPGSDVWTLVHVSGRPSKARGLRFDQDTHAVTDAGSQTVQLTHVPEEHSEDLSINGVRYAEADGWSRGGRIITVPAALVRAGDVIEVEYAYRGGLAGDNPISIIVPFGASGWNYKQIAPTDATDYSTAAYDDSAWTVGAAPLGHNGSTSRPIATAWDAETRLWLRRTFPAVTEATVTVKIEDNAHVWLNGTLVANIPTAGAGSANIDGITVEIPESALNATSVNVLAIRADDEYGEGTGPADNTWVDVQVEGRLA